MTKKSTIIKTFRYLCTSIIFFASTAFAFSNVSKNAKSEVGARQTAKAECVMEMESRRILYAFGADERLPMASTTKIVTAITVIENCLDIQKQETVFDESVGIEGSSVYLKKGDVFSCEDLLYGLMLRSGNDCAVELALRVGGSIEKFCSLMNATAQKAGALNSRFENPHGLPKENHYTTAKDLSLIACYAMHNKLFSEIVGTKYYEPMHWANKNKLLYQYSGAVGVKTGYTVEAGKCLVSAAKRNGMTLIGCVLNCPNTYGRTIQLFDDAFSAYTMVKIQSAQSPVSVEIDGKTVSCYVERDLYYPLLSEEEGMIRKVITPTKKDVWSGKKQKIFGQIEIYLGNQLLFLENLYKL